LATYAMCTPRANSLRRQRWHPPYPGRWAALSSAGNSPGACSACAATFVRVAS